MYAIRLFAIVSILGFIPLTVSAASVAPGDLIISEVMVDPDAASDTYGEWFEIHNLTGNSLNLDGLTLSDNGSNLHVIDNGGSLIIDPYGYLVFGRSGDQTINGGYTPDYVYTNFVLSNSGDEIIISNASVEIVRLEYSADFDMAGKSMELSGTVGFLLDDSNYVPSVSVYGMGDYGTPGQAGDSAWEVAVLPTPIPAAVWLFGSGLLGLLGLRKRPAICAGLG